MVPESRVKKTRVMVDSWFVSIKYAMTGKIHKQ